MPSPRSALLQALRSGPGYGLDLSDRVEALSRRRLVLGQGVLYPELRAMERDGLTRSWEADPTPERGGRPRRYYELTPAGQSLADGESTYVIEAFQVIVSLA